MVPLPENNKNKTWPIKLENVSPYGKINDRKDSFKDFASSVRQRLDEIKENVAQLIVATRTNEYLTTGKSQLSLPPQCFTKQIPISRSLTVSSLSRCKVSSADVCDKILYKVVPYYKLRDSMLEASYTDFSLYAMMGVDILFGGYLLTQKLSSTNASGVFQSLLEMEDIANLIRYVQLMQENVTLRSGSNQNQFLVDLKNAPSCIDDILSPCIDEIVLIPKTSFESDFKVLKKKALERTSVLSTSRFESLLTELKSLENAIEMLMPHEHESSDTPANWKRFTGVVKQVSRHQVCIHIFGVDKPNMTDRFYLLFRPTRLTLRYQYRALEMLRKNDTLRRYLFPGNLSNLNEDDKGIHRKSNYAVDSLELINTAIAENPEQCQAIHSIVRGCNPNAPFILFGPPGTGKTTTLVESILQLRLRDASSRILVTAGSNSACNTIALRICEYFESSSKLINHITNTKDIVPLLRIFSQSILRKGINNIPSVLLKYSNCTAGGVFIPKSFPDIVRCGIVVATLSTVGKIVTKDKVTNFFSHIFIDEASAATEPECLVGLMGLECKYRQSTYQLPIDFDVEHLSTVNRNEARGKALGRLILAGDHKQLGPILKSECAIRLGLQNSLMQRLLETGPCYAVDDNGNYDRTLQARLRRNYRSHPEIVRLYNKLYYNSELLPVADLKKVDKFNKWPILPNAGFPVIFQAVHGLSAREEASTSSFNALEIQVLFWYLHRLLVDGVAGYDGDADIQVPVKATDIGIITPYKSQCRKIMERLKQHSWSDVEVGSVETFQGHEKTVIIVSLVRSFSGLGFVRDPKRLNVILSRAKSLLIILGNPLTLRRYRDLKFVINECKRNGTYLRKKKQPQTKRGLQASDSSSDESSSSCYSFDESDKSDKSDLDDLNAATFTFKSPLNSVLGLVSDHEKESHRIEPDTTYFPSLHSVANNNHVDLHQLNSKKVKNDFDFIEDLSVEEIAQAFQWLYGYNILELLIPTDANLFESFEKFIQYFNKNISMTDIFTVHV